MSITSSWLGEKIYLCRLTLERGHVYKTSTQIPWVYLQAILSDISQDFLSLLEILLRRTKHQLGIPFAPRGKSNVFLAPSVGPRTTPNSVQHLGSLLLQGPGLVWNTIYIVLAHIFEPYGVLRAQVDLVCTLPGPRST